MNTSRCIPFVLLLALPFVGAGCAFGSRHAVLVYPPEGAPKEEPAAGSSKQIAPASVETTAAAAKGILVIGTVSDERADKKVVGHVRNGFGMKTARVLLETNVAEFVVHALRHELSRDGWTLLSPEQAANTPEAPTISAELLTFYCDAHFSYDGETTLLVHVSRAGKEVFKKTFAGTGSVGVNWAATGASYGRSLSLAMRDLIQALKRELPVALKQ